MSLKINRVKGVGHNYLSDINTVISNSSSQGIGDSLGTAAIALLVFDDPKDRADILAGIKSYFLSHRTSPRTGTHIYALRYPTGLANAARGNSRDHVLKAMAALAIIGDPFLDEFLKGRARRPCIDHPYTLPQKAMMKGFKSNFWSWVYVLTEAPWLFIMRGWNWLLRKIFKFKSVKDLPTFHALGVQTNRTKAQKWLTKTQVLFPTFAAFYGAFSAHGLKSESAKRFLLKYFLRPMFEPTNYVGRMLCGAKPDRSFLLEYVPSRKWRWSVRLDESNDRDMRMYPEDMSIPGANLEIATLFKLYENQEEYGAFKALGPKVQSS